MEKIVVATRNRHKVKEISELLSDMKNIELMTLDDAGFEGEIEENGKTFEENALMKAREASLKTGYAALADDSGLSVDALDGEPGIYSARYAAEDGKNAGDEKNIDKLLLKLSGIPEAERTARFVSAIALRLPDGREYCVRGICEGHITFDRRGSGGFGYDPVFFCPPFGKTFGELSASEKNSVSHRADGIRKMAVILKEIYHQTNS